MIYYCKYCTLVHISRTNVSHSQDWCPIIFLPSLQVISKENDKSKVNLTDDFYTWKILLLFLSLRYYSVVILSKVWPWSVVIMLMWPLFNFSFKSIECFRHKRFKENFTEIDVSMYVFISYYIWSVYSENGASLPF